MSDVQYFYRPYNQEARKPLTAYSDRVTNLTEWFPESVYGKPRFPALEGLKFETEFSDNYLVTTFSSPVGGVNRVVQEGIFSFNGNELIGGSISAVITVTDSGSISGKRFSTPISVTFSDPGSPSITSRASDPEIPGTSITTADGFIQFFPTRWASRPFEDNLVSVGSASGGSGSSSGSGGSSAPQPLRTTSSIDTLTGIKKNKDIFKFDAGPIGPIGQVDKVIGFNSKEKDILSISKSAFKIESGTFAIAKNAKTLAKKLGASADIVYYRKTGELILNANRSDPGYGDSGGVFAVLAGAPVVGFASVEFY